MTIPPRPEVAERLRELRYTRFLNATKDIPKIKGSCAWCGDALPGRLKYCGGACRDESAVRQGSGPASGHVLRRDQGICAACGMDCVYLRREYMRFVGVDRPWAWYTVPRKGWGPYMPAGGCFTFWEADHIVPVIEGGGCCGLDNYQTLCLRCHKDETRLLAGNRAMDRKLASGRGVQGEMDI